MRSVFLLVFLISALGFGQRKHKAPHYIFDVNVGFKSLMYTGVKDLAMAIEFDSDGMHNTVYTQEAWTSSYDFSASQGIQGGLGLNIISRPSYQLDITGMVGTGRFETEVISERTSYNNALSGFANEFYSEEFIATAMGGSVNISGNENTAQVAIRNEIRVFNNFWIGPQIGWHWVSRAYSNSISGYVPYQIPRTREIISTHQMYAGVTFSQKVRQFTFNLNISQAFLTTDRIKTIGSWDTDPEKAPSSLNLDYRFPTIVDFTVGFSFFQQKNGCGTCPNW